MLLLFRAFFWIALVALILPEGALTTWPKTVQQHQSYELAPFRAETIPLNRDGQDMVRYIADQAILLCEEHPRSCAAGDAAIHFVHVQAAHLSGLLHEWLKSRAQGYETSQL